MLYKFNLDLLLRKISQRKYSQLKINLKLIIKIKSIKVQTASNQFFSINSPFGVSTDSG